MAVESVSRVPIQNEEHSNIFNELVRSFSRLYISDPTEDFKVTVEGDTYSCHSCILASCSDFFGGLLRSEMKEKLEMKVKLINISSSVFKLILKTFYAEVDVLTTDNVLEVWSAVHQLQIQSQIKNCENFIMKNLSLDNLEMYMEHAEYLQSQIVCQYIFAFVLRNFSDVLDKELFLRFDFEYLTKLIQSDALAVSSEDDVLYSILKWVKYEETNERQQFLCQLLHTTRLYLASEPCLYSLYKDELVQNNIPIIESLFEAYKYKLCNRLQNYCPTKAKPRDSFGIEYVCVICDEGSISAFSFKRDRVVFYKGLPFKNYAQVTICKDKLYVYETKGTSNCFLVLDEGFWVVKTYNLKHDGDLLLSHGDFIYMLRSVPPIMLKLNPKTVQFEIVTCTPTIISIAQALVHDDNIVVFSSPVNNNGVEETAVHSWNTETQTWTQHDNLQLSSENMTSFCSDRGTFILECNGNLWKLTNSENFGFNIVAKLWTGKCVIKGALLFGKSLFIFGNFPDYKNTEIVVLDGVFNSIRLLHVSLTASNVSRFVMPINELLIDRY